MSISYVEMCYLNIYLCLYSRDLAHTLPAYPASSVFKPSALSAIFVINRSRTLARVNDRTTVVWWALCATAVVNLVLIPDGRNHCSWKNNNIMSQSTKLTRTFPGLARGLVHGSVTQGSHILLFNYRVSLSLSYAISKTSNRQWHFRMLGQCRNKKTVK